MTYTAVKKILADHDKKTIKEYKELVPMFERMEKLSYILKAMRVRRGAIDFDLPESHITLDKKGRPVDIVPYEHNVATAMIEQFMLSANETVAGHMFRQSLPFLYRVHETPDADRMNDLMELLFSFGYHIKGDPTDIKPGELQKMLSNIAGRPEEDLIRSLSLRSMKQAKYSTECLGHFGLAVKEYTHFTSPIRRYPDLQIHRILKDEIKGKLDKKAQEHFAGILDTVAKHSSDMERRAVDAEREANKIKMAEYMEYHIGEEYDGIIDGVTGWGMYVQLKNTVEGMVPISKMTGDDYDYNEREYAIVGRYTGRKYYLGQAVRIKVVSVDLALKTIDFELAGSDAASYDILEKKKAKGGKKQSGKKFSEKKKKGSKKKDKKADKKTGKKNEMKQSGKKKKSSKKGRYGVIE
jgi:ribonuclease R